MNIESTKTATITKTNDTSTSSSSANSISNEDKSFKEQLESVKTQDAKTAEDTKAADTATTQQTKAEETAKNNATQQSEKDRLKAEKDLTQKAEITDPIRELSSKIAAINDMKNGAAKSHGSESKVEETTDKNDHCATLKMDSRDLDFFLNLVNNQQMATQNPQAAGNTNINNMFSDIKSEATQKTVQISAALLDSLNDAAKTGKSVRIDFGNDIAVIMKVDKEGTLSANFIPGTAAVEAYLKDNIAGLRQSFNDQNLPYNQLSYSKQQKGRGQEENQQQQKNNKENENE